jgi:hypothetical protein
MSWAWGGVSVGVGALMDRAFYTLDRSGQKKKRAIKCVLVCAQPTECSQMRAKAKLPISSTYQQFARASHFSSERPLGLIYPFRQSALWGYFFCDLTTRTTHCELTMNRKD